MCVDSNIDDSIEKMLVKAENHYEQGNQIDKFTHKDHKYYNRQVITKAV